MKNPPDPAEGNGKYVVLPTPCVGGIGCWHS